MDTILNTIQWTDFSKIDMRVGTIISAKIFAEAKNPSYLLHIDFGPLGIKKSSAQITKLYKPENLIDKQVVAVVNFPAKQIANKMSECLVLGGLETNSEVILLQPDRKISNGTKIG